MKAVVLAAGYATRLRPLTDTWAKELLPVGGRPIVDWILDAIAAVAAVDEVHLVTNHRKVDAFTEWAASRGVHVHDDGTTTNDDRLGAIGDLRFVVDSAPLDDDLLVIAGDNLFEFSLADYVSFWRAQGVATLRRVAVPARTGLRLAVRRSLVRHRRRRAATRCGQPPAGRARPGSADRVLAELISAGLDAALRAPSSSRSLR